MNVISEKRKIVYVVEALGGGVLTYLEQLCNNLPENFEVTLLYGVREQTPKNLRNHFIKRVKLIEIKNFKRNVNPVSDFKAYKEIKKNVEEITPSIVHLNSSKAGALGRIMKFINFKNYKNIDFYYTPHGYAFLMGDVSKIKKFVYYFIEKILGILNVKTIACGKGEYNYARRISSNSTYVNNAVDCKFLNNFKNDNSNTQSDFYTVGRITYQKNPELFNKIALRNPDKKFIWIGDGPERKTLSAKNIEVTGWMNSDELYKKVQPYRFFILCSRWEGLPIALLESMAFGKNVFVTNVSGNKEVISDGRNGIIFSDELEFDEKLNSKSDEDLERMSVCSKNDVNKNYSIENFVKEYIDIYKK